MSDESGKRCSSRAWICHVSERELQTIVDAVVQSRLEFVKAKGVGAVGPSWGVVMKQVRGKADGKLVNEVLHAKILSVLQ